jgi:hypothetical protein
MRVGEMLLLKERIDPWILTRTLKEQAATRQRLVSILVSRALLDLDEGATLLSEQLGYPAAMERHLERRDPSLITTIPAELGGRWVVLPLGRARTGALIVCARDPSPILQAALEHATRHSIVLAVTPALQLERLVRAAYGLTAPAEEPLPQVAPTVNDIGDFRLEDTPVPTGRRPRTVSDIFIRTDPELPPARAPAPIDPLEATLAEIDRALNAAAVERLVMAHAARRWSSALLCIVSGDEAIGHKGVNVADVERVAIRLASLSSLRIAHDTRRATAASPASPAQLELCAALANARRVAAVPVIVENHVVALLAAGEPLADGPRDSIPELDRLADALGAAYARFGR